MTQEELKQAAMELSEQGVQGHRKSGPCGAGGDGGRADAGAEVVDREAGRSSEDRSTSLSPAPAPLKELAAKFRAEADAEERQKNEAIDARWGPGENIHRAKMLTLRACADAVDRLPRASQSLTFDAWWESYGQHSRLDPDNIPTDRDVAEHAFRAGVSALSPQPPTSEPRIKDLLRRLRDARTDFYILPVSEPMNGEELDLLIVALQALGSPQPPTEALAMLVRDMRRIIALTPVGRGISVSIVDQWVEWLDRVAPTSSPESQEHT